MSFRATIDLLEVDITVAKGTEIPVSASVSEIGVTSKNTCATVTVSPPGVLHVDVVDTIGEGAQKLDIVDSLIAKMGGVIVKAESLVEIDRLESSLGRGDVECNLSGMDLQAEVDVDLVEFVEDWGPSTSEVSETLLQEFLAGGRKGIDGMPNAGTGESVYGEGELCFTFDFRFEVEKFATCSGGLDHLLSGPAAAHRPDRPFPKHREVGWLCVSRQSDRRPPVQ